MDDHSRVTGYLRQNGGHRLTLAQERRRQKKLNRALHHGKFEPGTGRRMTAAKAAEQAGRPQARILQQTAPAPIRWSKGAQKDLAKTQGPDKQAQRQLRLARAQQQASLLSKAMRVVRRGRG